MSSAAVQRVRARLAEGPIVLDGGLGTLLESDGGDVASPLWSAKILLEEPDHVIRAHREFFDAGAEIAISASYQASFEGFAALGLAPVAVERLLHRSVDIAREAAGSRAGVAARGGQRHLVAASVGPYGAMLADGAEYRGDYGLDVDELTAWHEPRIRVLAASGADLLAVETIPSIAEVEAVTRALSGSGAAAWIALTPSLGRTRRGESLADAFAVAASSDEVVAVGVNCCYPSEVLDAIVAARSVTDKAVVVYPNSGEQWDAKNKRWTGTAAFPPDLVERWLDAGASIVGGCCRVGPGEIRGISATVERHVHPTPGASAPSSPA